MKPKIGILDRRFRYVSAAKTDVAETFRRERERLKEVERKQALVRGKVLVPIRKEFPNV
jgi:hypothetical protein